MEEIKRERKERERIYIKEMGREKMKDTDIEEMDKWERKEIERIYIEEMGRRKMEDIDIEEMDKWEREKKREREER